MTVPQIARRLGISEGAVRMALTRKTLKGDKYGRDWFVEPEEVERYAAENLGNTGRPKNNPDSHPLKDGRSVKEKK